jgi:hypothetical protein
MYNCGVFARSFGFFNNGSGVPENGQRVVEMVQASPAEVN